MQGKTHEIIGIATASTIICTSNTLSNNKIGCMAILGGVVIGSFLPDIDLQTSTAGQKFKFFSWPLAFLRMMLRFISKIFSSFKSLSKLLAHRGIFHAPLVYLLIYLILYMNKEVFSEITFLFINGVFLGILCHLIADFFSGGIPLFCPIYNKRIVPFIKFKSGGIVNIVMIGISSIIIVFNISKIFARM